MKVAVATLGCKVNQYESAGIAEALEKEGFHMVPFNRAADYYIINTCTVTGRADMQSRQLIRRAAHTNPQAQIIVTGCYANLAADTLKKMAGVALVTDRKAMIPAALKQAVKAGRSPFIAVNGPSTDLSVLKPLRFPDHTRAFLKIQDGCSSRCSYCIIPIARGPGRSLSEAEVIERLHALRRAGFLEVVLTGIHLGAYGVDLTPPASLFNVLRKAEQEGVVERLRLSSIEPLEITDQIIDLLSRSQRLCRHLHIPLQSGDDETLKRMGRPYDSGYFTGLLDKLWQKIPDMAIGVDVMVGFPGEDEAAFHRTFQLISEAPVAYLHVFPYSERPGTAAAEMPGKVGDKEKKRRAEILRALGKRKRSAFAEKFVGRTMTVLIENKNAGNGGLWQGFSDNYVPVLIEAGEACLGNRIVKVSADQSRDGKLYGRIIDE